MALISRRILAALVFLCILISGTPFLLAADAVQTPAWPMHATASDGADVTIFQPQLQSFEGDTLSGLAAVAVVPSGQEEPVYGTVWLQSRVETDRVSRTVRIEDVKVTKVQFPPSVSAQALPDAVRQTILSHPIVISLDHLLASVEAIEKEKTAAADLQTTPPAIVFRDHPAVKVQYDGTAKLVQESESGLMRVVNTPFFVALDPSTRTYFLKGAGHWFAAPDPMGPFHYVAQAPAAISELAAHVGYTDPQQAVTDDVASRLEIVTATEPTELIWTDGPPQMSTIPGTGLLYWANTDSDVFLEIGTQQTYVLLSGRWFTSHGTGGPWTFVAANQLPGDFAKIPPDSAKGNVLADVAGTQAAADAVADTYIPQTAAVDINNFQQPAVAYDGNPDFEPVQQGMNLSYAVNTDQSVLQYNGAYYCCDDGVWYQGVSATGPWGLCRQVPAEIYSIPPSCPIYPVRFCYVYGATAQFVYCGYTPGYVGCYPFDGAVVYGTGYRYHSWYHDHYFARPATFGFAARYHGYTGHWGFSFGLAAGGGNAWIAAGEGAHPSAWFGYGGYRPSMARASANINRAIISANNANAQAARDIYGRNVYERRRDVRVEAARAVPSGPAVREDFRANNVYANPEGEIYRRTETGWERREGNAWRAEPNGEPARGEPARAEPAREPMPQERVTPNVSGAPERDYRVRQQGVERGREGAPAAVHAEAGHAEAGHETPGHAEPGGRR